MEDTLIFSEETLSLRLKTAEELSFSISIRDPGPSDPEITTNHSTSKAQEDPTTSMSGALTPTGGKSSSMMEPSSPMFTTIRSLKSKTEKMLKDKTLEYTLNLDTATKDGRLCTLMLWEMKLTLRKDLIRTSDLM
jgi:hypothetical protein